MDPFALFMLWAAMEVGVIVGLAVRLIQLIVGRIRGRRFSRSTGRQATLRWALGFALGAFAAASFISIGILVLPFAAIACGVARGVVVHFPRAQSGAAWEPGSFC